MYHLEEFAKSYKFDINPKLTSEQRLAVLKVMYQYKSVFARSLQDVKIFSTDILLEDV